MTTVYRLIPKKTNVIYQCDSASDLSIYMLGRIVDSYIVIKSDSAGDRVVTFTDYEISAIVNTLNQA